MAFTLEYNSVERSFEDWGVEESKATLTLANQAPDVFTVEVPGALVTADPIWPFEAEVIIRKGRAGAGTAWAGGSVIFQGKQVKHLGSGTAGYEGVAYVFQGPWYDLEETPYQQTIYSVNPAAEDPSLPAGWFSWKVSEVVLFQLVTGPGTWVARNNGQQLGDILQHVLDEYAAQGMTAPYQVGTIAPATTLYTYQVRDLKAAEAIRICLRCEPDATVWFDYSTVPPTVNVSKRAGATAVAVAVADLVNHEEIHLAERPDLQARSVVLYFKQTHDFNGQSLVTNTKQKYGPNGLNHASDPEGGRRVLVMTIDLQGGSRTDVFGELKVFAAAPTTRAFWKRYYPEYQSSKIRNFSAGNLRVVDDLGAAVSLGTYPNVCEDGSNIASWMKLGGTTPVVGRQVTISVDVSFTQWDVEGTGGSPETATNGVLKDQIVMKQLSTRVTLTNGTTGNYSAIASESAGEDIPTGLAQTVYDSLAQLQYEGSVALVEEECGTAVTLANVLNLTGGKTAWSTMRAQIQQVKFSYGSGRTEITVGPAKHLGPGDLTELFLINRNRRVFYDPSTQATARSSHGGGSVSLPKTLAKENTTAGLDSLSIGSIIKNLGTGNSVVVQHSAEAKSIVMHEVVNATGVRDATKAAMELLLADLPAGEVLKIRKRTWKDHEHDCAVWGCYVVCSEPKAEPV